MSRFRKARLRTFKARITWKQYNNLKMLSESSNAKMATIIRQAIDDYVNPRLDDLKVWISPKNARTEIIDIDKYRHVNFKGRTEK